MIAPWWASPAGWGGSVCPVAGPGAGGAVGVVDRAAEAGRELVVVGVADPEPLEPRPLPRDEFDVSGRDAELLGEERGGGGVRAVVDRWCRDPQLQRASVTAEDGAASRARLDVDREDDRVILDGVQVVDVADGKLISGTGS